MQGKTTDNKNSLSKTPPRKASSNLALVPVATESDPFRRLIFQFLDFCRADDISPKTIKDYTEKTFKFWWWWAKHTRYADTLGAHPKFVTEKEARQFAAYLREPQTFRWGEKIRPGKEILSPASVSSYGRTIKILFSWLEDQQYIDRSPFSHKSVKFSNRHKKDRVVKTVESEEIGRLFAYLTDKDHINTYEGCRNLAIVALLCDSGIRRGELLSLKLSDLELARNRCQVRGKTGHRWALFSDICKNALVKYLQNYRKGQTERRETPLWLCRDGLPLSEEGFSSIMTRLSRRSGVKFHAHRFRHTYASLMASQGADLYALKELLGHSNVTTTQIYLHSNIEILANVYHPRAPLNLLAENEVQGIQRKKRRGRPRKGQSRAVEINDMEENYD